MQTAWKEYQDQHKQRFLDEMLDLLRIPSVSAKSEHKQDMHRCAELVRQRLLEAGCDKAEVMETKGHPVVYGEKIIDPSRPTVLVYGHYDVQPPDPLDEWVTPPFEPTVRDGKLFARGAVDDKGQVYCLLKAYEAALDANRMPPCNVRFIFEGEEESGGHWMRWPRGRPEDAHFVCRECGCEIQEADKRAMLDAGTWVATKPTKRHASFHVWAAYSYSPNATWGQIALEFEEANAAGVDALVTSAGRSPGNTSFIFRGESPIPFMVRQLKNPDIGFLEQGREYRF